MSDYYNEINDIAMNPRHDEFMDVDNYNSLIKSSNLEYGGFEKTTKVKKSKATSGLSGTIIKADLVATIALVTAVVGPSIVSDRFEDIFSPVSCNFVETIAETDSINYYLSIDSLEKTLGDIELRISDQTGLLEIRKVKEGKNIGELNNLKENNNYTIALYDGGYLVKKTEVKTLTVEEREERAWRKFFPNFLDINYDKESDELSVKMKVVDDLDRYDFIYIDIMDEEEGSTGTEFSAEEKNLVHSFKIRENEIYGQELSIRIMGFLKYQEEEIETEMPEEILYEGTFMLDERVERPEEPPFESKVSIDLASYIIGLDTIDYIFNASGLDEAVGSVYVSVDATDFYQNIYLVSGKNVGVISDLPMDSIVTLSYYDGEHLIGSTELKTLSEEEYSSRHLTKFYLDYLVLAYTENNGELSVTMKMIDDDEIYLGYIIEVANENGGEASIQISSETVNNTHFIDLVENKITPDVIKVIIKGIKNTQTNYSEDILCQLTYNIEEDTYLYEEETNPNG